MFFPSFFSILIHISLSFSFIFNLFHCVSSVTWKIHEKICEKEINSTANSDWRQCLERRISLNSKKNYRQLKWNFQTSNFSILFFVSTLKNQIISQSLFRFFIHQMTSQCFKKKFLNGDQVWYFGLSFKFDLQLKRSEIQSTNLITPNRSNFSFIRSLI